MTNTASASERAPRARTRATAKQAGSSMERLVADYLKAHGFPFADRRVKTGAKDRGDVGGIHVHGFPVAVEVKNTARIALAAWVKEAETERINDSALAGVIVHKRHGKATPGDQLVTMTLADLTALLTGKRPAK